MKNKKIRWSYFDTNVGDYDDFNPRYVYSRSQVPEISYLIASNAPFNLSKNDIAEILQINIDTCIKALDAMHKIDAVSLQTGKYKINFPVFLEKDLVSLADFCKDIGKALGEKIISLKDEIDTKLARLTHYKRNEIERLRYHVVGCDTLDGGALEYFAKNKLLTVSKVQPGARDYLIIGNEEGTKAHEFSTRILCSCNIFYSDNIGFASFGDADGSRKDMMRFFRRLQGNMVHVTEHDLLNRSYIKLIDDYNKLIAEKAASLLLGSIKEDVYYFNLNEQERNLVEFLRELGYVSYDDEKSQIQCPVPVFEAADRKIINEISNLIVENIYDTVKQTIETLDKSLPDLTSVKHGVDFKDIANELWHLIFGPINEYLVESGFFPTPEYKKGEGRYFQCLYIY